MNVWDEKLGDWRELAIEEIMDMIPKPAEIIEAKTATEAAHADPNQAHG